MEEANEAIRISPHELAVFDVVAVGYMAQNRADEAKAVLSTGLGSNPENANIHFDLYAVAAALGDEAGMQRELQWASGKLAGVNLLGVAAPGRAAHVGELKKARGLSEQALQITRENNFKDSAAGVEAFEALLEAEVGNFGQARERAAASVALSRTRTNLPGIAVALPWRAIPSRRRALLMNSTGATLLTPSRMTSSFLALKRYWNLIEATQLEAYKLCSQPFGMNWALFISSCRSTCEGSFICILRKARRPRLNSRES